MPRLHRVVIAADAVDTVIIPGALSAQADPLVDPAIVEWIGAHHARWTRIASVCAGAHMLAAAGLLDGRRVTTRAGNR